MIHISQRVKAHGRRRDVSAAGKVRAEMFRMEREEVTEQKHEEEKVREGNESCFLITVFCLCSSSVFFCLFFFNLHSVRLLQDGGNHPEASVSQHMTGESTCDPPLSAWTDIYVTNTNTGYMMISFYTIISTAQ